MTRLGPAAAAALGLTGAALLACLPLLTASTLPRGDDVGEHVQFAQDFAAGLGEGVLYPRWLPHANLGYGAPAFIFYPPLATALVAILNLAGLQLFASFRGAVLLLTLLSAASAAALGRHLGRSWWYGLAMGALWVLLPYHAIDIYSRFALAETATFMFLPLLLLGLESRRPRAAALITAAAFAGLCLSHLPTALLAGWAAIIWSALSRGLRRAVVTAGALVLGAACAAVYVLPAVVERPEIHADWLEGNPVYRFDAHYLFFPVPTLVQDDPVHGDLAGRLETPTLAKMRVVAPATLALTFLAWGLRRWRLQAHADKLDRYMLLALVATLAMTRLSDPLWRHVPGFASVVFPWRLAVFLTLACAVLAGATVCDLLRTDSRRFEGLTLLTVALAAGIGLSAWAAATCDWATFTPTHATRPVVSLRVAGALMPRSNAAMRGFRNRPFAGPVRLVAMDGSPAGSIEPLRGEGLLRDYQVTVRDSVTAWLQVPQFDYPGWSARVDGALVAHRREPPLGTLSIPVPPGSHRVEVRFGSTPWRRAAAWLSLLALITLVALTTQRGDRTMAAGGDL